MYILDSQAPYTYIQIAFGWQVPTGPVFEKRDPSLSEQYNIKIKIDRFLHAAGIHTVAQGVYSAKETNGGDGKYFVVTALHPTPDVNNLFEQKMDTDNGLLDSEVYSQDGTGISWRVWGQVYASEPFPDSILTGDHPENHRVQIDAVPVTSRAKLAARL